MSKAWRNKFTDKELQEIDQVDAEERMGNADEMKRRDREYEQQTFKDRNFQYDYEVKDNENDRGR